MLDIGSSLFSSLSREVSLPCAKIHKYWLWRFFINFGFGPRLHVNRASDATTVLKLVWTKAGHNAKSENTVTTQTDIIFSAVTKN